MVRLTGLLLAVLMLCGCGMIDDSYVSVTPHQAQLNQTAGGKGQEVGSYSELRNALIALVDKGETEGLFILSQYPREAVHTDMDKAVSYVCNTYAVGAYAVQSIRYDLGTGLGSTALSVDITYRSGAESLDRIRTVRWISGANEAIHEALEECDERLVLQITGYQDTNFAEEVERYAMENPARVMEAPGVTARVYPERGDTRVVELTFHYRTSRKTLRSMREQVQPVFASAYMYVSPETDDRTKASQLHSFLMERFEYEIGMSVTPSYSLLCKGIGDSKAFAQVYAAMCRSNGIEAQCVRGMKDGQRYWWNQLYLDGTWYHVDLLGGIQFTPLLDEEMVGYEWGNVAPAVIEGFQ